MSAVIQTPADVVNAALSRVGEKRRVGSLLEGSDVAKVALDIYGQTRDQLLRIGNFHWARRSVALTQLKAAPAGGYVATPWTNAFPQPPWAYEYTYPADCIEIRNIFPQPAFLANYDPQNFNYTVANDTAYVPARKVILTNVPAVAMCVYTGQVTDPTTWEASFTEALIAALAERFVPALAAAQLKPVETADAERQADKAMQPPG